MEFKVTLADVDAAAKSSRDTALRVDGHIGTLRSYVANLLGTYMGPASFMLQTVMDNYDAQSRRINAALSAIGDGLDGNSANYNETETVNRAAYIGILANLPPANL